MVPQEGLEPSRLATTGPKPAASTDSATGADGREESRPQTSSNAVAESRGFEPLGRFLDHRLAGGSLGPLEQLSPKHSSLIVVGAEGLEHSTPASQTRCANQTALRSNSFRIHRIGATQSVHFIGPGRRIRTFGLIVPNDARYLTAPYPVLTGGDRGTRSLTVSPL